MKIASRLSGSKLHSTGVSRVCRNLKCKCIAADTDYIPHDELGLEMEEDGGDFPPI